MLALDIMSAREVEEPAPVAPSARGWENTGSVPVLESGDVHVWQLALTSAADMRHALMESLSTDERARASRFCFEKHADRFIAGRAHLRRLLALYAGDAPENLVFAYGSNGKPELPQHRGVRFNLSHSGDAALLAVTREQEIGADIEEIRPLSDAAELVARFFSSRENELFQRLPLEQRSLAFFNLWTRKEALLKATGQGIAHALREVEVSLAPGETARFIALPKGLRVEDWSLAEPPTIPGFVAAVAVCGQVHRWSHFRWISQ